MTDRVQRLETAVQRLCDIVQRILPRTDVVLGNSMKSELELIKQYIRGELEPTAAPSEASPIRGQPGGKNETSVQG